MLRVTMLRWEWVSGDSQPADDRQLETINWHHDYGRNNWHTLNSRKTTPNSIKLSDNMITPYLPYLKFLYSWIKKICKNHLLTSFIRQQWLQVKMLTIFLNNISAFSIFIIFCFKWAHYWIISRTLIFDPY